MGTEQNACKCIVIVLYLCYTIFCSLYIFCIYFDILIYYFQIFNNIMSHSFRMIIFVDNLFCIYVLFCFVFFKWEKSIYWLILILGFISKVNNYLFYVIFLCQYQELFLLYFYTTFWQLRFHLINFTFWIIYIFGFILKFKIGRSSPGTSASELSAKFDITLSPVVSGFWACSKLSVG